MSRGKSTTRSPNQEQVPEGITFFNELNTRATNISNTAKRIGKNLQKGGSLLASSRTLQPLREHLRELASLLGALDALEASWAAQIEREFLEIESSVREAFASRGWRVDGQWPKLYVERAIPLEFDESDRSFRVSNRKIPGASAVEVAHSLEAHVAALLPPNFSEERFIASMMAAYDELRESMSAQVPILMVYQRLVIRTQKSSFWKDARSEAFVGLSLDQFRARLSRALENGIKTSDAREIRLLPPIDPKDGIFLYQPAERRFGFVGRIEFISARSTGA